MANIESYRRAALKAWRWHRRAIWLLACTHLARALRRKKENVTAASAMLIGDEISGGGKLEMSMLRYFLGLSLLTSSLRVKSNQCASSLRLALA